MAFTDFKDIADVQKKYGVRLVEENFINAEPLLPPQHLRDDFEFTQKMFDVFDTEASRCELVISPLLREAYKPHADNYLLSIQKSISCDEDLTGIPDYILSRRSELGKSVLGAPLVMTVEAKRNDFEQGWGQCLAEMYAAQRMNSDDSVPIYGIVTDARLWQFGKLLGSVFTQNINEYLFRELAKLYGVLNFIFQSACH